MGKLAVCLIVVVGCLVAPSARGFENFEPSPHSCHSTPSNARVQVSHTSARYTDCPPALEAVHHYIANDSCLSGRQYCTLTHIHWGCNTRIYFNGNHHYHHTVCTKIGHAAEAHFSWHFR